MKMGKKKYTEKIEELFKKSPVVSYNSIERIIKEKKNIKQYAKQLTKNLISKSKINRLAKGYYTSHDDASLAVFCFKPSYLGLQDALSIHNLWEQETIPIIITSTKARQGIRKVMKSNIMIRRINKKYMFGFEYHQTENLVLPYSDIEKTFIDMIYFREKFSKEALKNLKTRINKKTLSLYLKCYPKKFRETVTKLQNDL